MDIKHDEQMIRDIIRCFKTKELFLLLLLMFVLVWVHSTGMITMLTLWCLFFIFVVPFKYYSGKLLFGILIFTFLYGSLGVLSGFMTLPKLMGLCLPMCFFYILGKFIVIRVKKPAHLILVLAILLLCYQSEVYYTFFQTQLVNEYSFSGTRLFYLRGDEGRRLTATLVGLNIYVSMVGLSAFVILKGYNKLRLLFLAMFLIAIMITIYLLNRTGLVIAAVCTIVSLAYFYKNKRMRLLTILAVMILASIFVFILGLIDTDVIMAYSERNIDVQTVGQRTMKWTTAFEHLFRYPFGWTAIETETQNYAHNMWLDIARVTGIMPFLALLALSFNAMFIQFRLLKITADIFVAVSSGLNMCFVLSCFVEPVYGGLHLFLWTMLWGMQEQYYVNHRKQYAMTLLKH